MWTNSRFSLMDPAPPDKVQEPGGTQPVIGWFNLDSKVHCPYGEYHLSCLGMKKNERLSCGTVCFFNFFINTFFKQIVPITGTLNLNLSSPPISPGAVPRLSRFIPVTSGCSVV